MRFNIDSAQITPKKRVENILKFILWSHYPNNQDTKARKNTTKKENYTNIIDEYRCQNAQKYLQMEFNNT